MIRLDRCCILLVPFEILLMAHKAVGISLTFAALEVEILLIFHHEPLLAPCCRTLAAK
jgi:hypothetical protein